MRVRKDHSCKKTRNNPQVHIRITYLPFSKILTMPQRDRKCEEMPRSRSLSDEQLCNFARTFRSAIQRHKSLSLEAERHWVCIWAPLLWVLEKNL